MTDPDPAGGTSAFEAAVDEGDEPVVIEPVDAAVTLLVFGGLAQMPGMPPLEFFRVTAGLPVRRVFVRDRYRALYAEGLDGLGGGLPGVAQALAPVVRDADRLVVVGNSAGGTAALVVGTALAADEILAFVPITFVDRWNRARHLDRRWPREVARARKGDTPDVRRWLLDHPPRSAQVWYGVDARLDRIHAERLPAAGVTRRPVPGSGHGIINALRADGSLRRILSDATAT